MDPFWYHRSESSHILLCFLFHFSKARQTKWVANFYILCHIHIAVLSISIFTQHPRRKLFGKNTLYKHRKTLFWTPSSFYVSEDGQKAKMLSQILGKISQLKWLMVTVLPTLSSLRVLKKGGHTPVRTQIWCCLGQLYNIHLPRHCESINQQKSIANTKEKRILRNIFMSS